MKDIEYYIDLLIEADNDRKMKRVVDKLLKEKTDKFEDKNNLISEVFGQHPECLEYVDYDILKKHSTFGGADKSSELLATMLETSETNASDIKDKEDFYARYVSGSLRQCDDQTLANYILDKNKPEVDMALFKNPDFIKTPSMIEKYWEKIEANLKSTTDGATTDGATTETKSYDKEFVVDVFTQHIANLDQDKRADEVAAFIEIGKADFFNDILSVLNKNALLQTNSGIIRAFVTEAAKDSTTSTNFNFSEFQNLIAKNETAFNKYLESLPPAPAASDATTAPAEPKEIKTLKDCLAKMDASKVYEIMSRENAEKFANYMLNENKPEVDEDLFNNPAFIKTPSMIEKYWEKIKANTASYKKDFVVNVFAQHIANLDQDKRVNAVMDFIGMDAVDFSNKDGHDILSVLDKNASLKKEAGVIKALVEKAAKDSTTSDNFDFSKFQNLIAKNKTAFNACLKSLSDPIASAASDEITTLKNCLAKMKDSDPTLISKVYELMSRENAEKFSTTFIEAKSEIYESKKCPKSVDNSLAYVKNGGDMDNIPSKLRKKDDLAQNIAKHYVGLIDKKEALPDWLNGENKWSALIDKMQSFNKKSKNNKEIIGAIRGSDFFKGASLDHKREFFAKLDQRYLVEQRTNIIEQDPACLFVKVKDHSYTFLVEKSGDCGKKDLENLSIAALQYILKPEKGTVKREIKDFAGCLPNEILSDKKLIKNMLDECRNASADSKSYVGEFFGNLDYENKSVKENIGKMMRLAATTNPEVLKTVKGKDSDLYEKVIKTRIGKKALYKAIVVDPKVVVEKGKEKETLENFRPLQKFAVAQACVSKMAKAGSDPIYGKILNEVCEEYKDKRWARVKIRKLMNKLVKYNPDKFADMYIANANDPNKNISDILDKNLEQNRQILIERLGPKYAIAITAAVNEYNDHYEELVKQQDIYNKEQITNLYEARRVNMEKIALIETGLGECKTIEDLTKILQEHGLDNDAMKKILKDCKGNVDKALKGVQEYYKSEIEALKKANIIFTEELKRLDPDGKLAKTIFCEALSEAELKNMANGLGVPEGRLNNLFESARKNGITISADIIKAVNSIGDPSALEVTKTDRLIENVNKDIEEVKKYKANLKGYEEDCEEYKLQVVNFIKEQISSLKAAQKANDDEIARIEKSLEDNKVDSKITKALQEYYGSELDKRKVQSDEYKAEINKYEEELKKLDPEEKLRAVKVEKDWTEDEFGKKMEELEALEQWLKEQGKKITICNVETPKDLSTLTKPEQVGKFIEDKKNEIVKIQYNNFVKAYNQFCERCKEQKYLRIKNVIADLKAEIKTNKTIIRYLKNPASLTAESIESTINNLEIVGDEKIVKNVKSDLIDALKKYKNSPDNEKNNKDLKRLCEAYETANKEFGSIIEELEEELKKLDPDGKLKDTTAVAWGDDQYNKNVDQLEKIEEALVEYNKDKTIRETCETQDPQPDLELTDVKSAETIIEEVKEKVKKGLIAELENKSNAAEAESENKSNDAEIGS